MVFENITLFELHLENSRFGPSFGDEDVEAEEEYADEGEQSEDSSGGGIGRVIGALVLMVVVGLAVRRFRSGGEAEPEEYEAEGDGITIEHAAEQ